MDKIGPIIKTITAAIQKESKILQEKGYNKLVRRQIKSITVMGAWVDDL